MSYFANINKDDDDITFQIQNKSENKIPIKVCLVNSLRRVILTDVPIISISELKTQFTKNTSMLNNAYLSHRMGLVSILNTPLIKANFENISINLNKQNESDDMITYYLKDFEVKLDDKEIENDKIFKFPNTPIGKIKHGQSVIMSTKLIESNNRKSGASFCPVGTCVYYFDYDKNMENDDKERFYKKDGFGNPLIYNFSIESSGQLEPDEIFSLGINTLNNKLNDIKKDLVDKNKIKVIFNKSPTIMKAVDLKIFDENDTIGNLLVKYIQLIEKVDYVAYDIVHPLVNDIIIRIAYKENNYDEISDLIVRTIDYLMIFLNNLKEEWEKKNQ